LKDIKPRLNGSREVLLTEEVDKRLMVREYDYAFRAVNKWMESPDRGNECVGLLLVGRIVEGGSAEFFGVHRDDIVRSHGFLIVFLRLV
jgi:hypothetical protein